MSQSPSCDSELSLRGVPELEKPQERTVDYPNNQNPNILSEKKNEVSFEYPSNQKRIVIMIALYLTIFLVTLVQHRTEQGRN